MSMNEHDPRQKQARTSKDDGGSSITCLSGHDSSGRTSQQHQQQQQQKQEMQQQQRNGDSSGNGIRVAVGWSWVQQQRWDQR